MVGSVSVVQSALDFLFGLKANRRTARSQSDINALFSNSEQQRFVSSGLSVGDVVQAQMPDLSVNALENKLGSISLWNQAITSGQSEDISSSSDLEDNNFFSTVDSVFTPSLNLSHSKFCGCDKCSYREEKSFNSSMDGSSFENNINTGTFSEMAGFIGSYDQNGLGFHNLTSSDGNDPNNGVLYYNFDGWGSGISPWLRRGDSNGITEDRKALFRDVFQVYGEVLGIDFRETSSTDTSIVDFFISDKDSGAYAGSYTWGNGEIDYSLINVQASWSGGTSTYDDYTLQTIWHEVAHALGVGHLGNYNGSATYGDEGTVFANDSWQASMMSYFSQTENTTTNASFNFLQTAMPADWLALDSIYGSQGYGVENAFVGDTWWGFNTNITGEVSRIWNQFSVYGGQTASTIIDSGGHDTLDLSGWSDNTVIDLRPTDANSTSPFASSLNGEVGNLLIAVDTYIEDAYGGSSGEIFYGNAVNNKLWGGGGNDVFYDSLGQDYYFGEDGVDDQVWFEFSYDTTSIISFSDYLQIGGDLDHVYNTVEYIYFNQVEYSYQEILGDLGGNVSLDYIPTVNFLATNSLNPSLTGTTGGVNLIDNSNLQLKVEVGDVDYSSLITLSSDGIGWSLQLPELLEGVYDVEVSLTDASTNESNVDLTQNELVIDITPPSNDSVDNLESPDTDPLELTGLATIASGDLLRVRVVSANNVTVFESEVLFEQAAFAWSVQVDAGAIEVGEYTIISTLTDSVGNTSVEKEGILTITDALTGGSFSLPKSSFVYDGIDTVTRRGGTQFFDDTSFEEVDLAAMDKIELDGDGFVRGTTKYPSVDSISNSSDTYFILYDVSGETGYIYHSSNGSKQDGKLGNDEFIAEVVGATSLDEIINSIV